MAPVQQHNERNDWKFMKLIAVYNSMLFSMPKFNFYLVCYTFHRKRPAFFSLLLSFFIFTIFNFIMHFSLHAFHSSWYIFKIWYFEDMRFDRSKCGSSNDSNSVLFTWFCIVCVLFRITTVRNRIFVEILIFALTKNTIFTCNGFSCSFRDA